MGSWSQYLVVKNVWVLIRKPFVQSPVWGQYTLLSFLPTALAGALEFSSSLSVFPVYLLSSFQDDQFTRELHSPLAYLLFSPSLPFRLLFECFTFDWFLCMCRLAACELAKWKVLQQPRNGSKCTRETPVRVFDFQPSLSLTSCRTLCVRLPWPEDLWRNKRRAQDYPTDNSLVNLFTYAFFLHWDFPIIMSILLELFSSFWVKLEHRVCTSRTISSTSWSP